MKQVIIAIDFDGTIVDHKFPNIGEPVPYAIHWIKRFKELGAKLILWTVRNDREEGKHLTNALEYCKASGLEFDGANCQLVEFTQSPKAYANIYIDDAAFGCPLVYQGPGESPYVNWEIVGPHVERYLIDVLHSPCEIPKEK